MNARDTSYEILAGGQNRQVRVHGLRVGDHRFVRIDREQAGGRLKRVKTL